VNRRFLAIAQNPSIIHGAHHFCDEWCDYCPITSRCLGFLCTEAFRKEHGRLQGDPTFTSTKEAAEFTRELCVIDGSSTEELDAILKSPSGASGLETNDPLASVAWQYAIDTALAFEAETIAIMTDGPRRRDRPTDEEVVLWHHLRIYFRVTRALVSAQRAHEQARLVEDANGCAKLVLVSIERSRLALLSLRSSGRKPEIDRLLATLGSLQSGVEEKFPDAPRYIRAGLDCPVA
jgi:hypothetical protein